MSHGSSIVVAAGFRAAIASCDAGGADGVAGCAQILLLPES